MYKLLPLSLYIHIPWCLQKCPYCDFNSYTFKNDIPHILYVQHLLKDLEQDLPLILGRKISTIFIGGGTPSLLSENAMQMLIEGIKNRLSLKSYIEISIEVNPGAVNIQKFNCYQQIGINRISIGAQSFNSYKLKCLGRRHSPEDTKLSIHMISEIGFKNFNLDIIYGLPNQSLEEAMDDLQKAILLNPPHLSWYQLTIEPNTLFEIHPPKLPEQDELWKIFKQGHKILISAGYKQYEVSAYAKPGYRCKHNLNYWNFNDYLGIGCGAHGKSTQLDGRIIRTVKTRHPFKFMKGKYLSKKYEVLDEDKPFEFFMNRFRLMKKVSSASLYYYTGINEQIISKEIRKAINLGYISEQNSTWLITKKGKNFLNSLLEIFLK